MILWAIYPHGEKIGSGEANPVAFFVCRESAMAYCKMMYPQLGEVLPIYADQVQFELEEQ